MNGEIVSHYRIEREIGSGGMGVVYRAQDTRLGRAVALKFLPAPLGRDSAALERFRREARAASGLNHPNICTIYDIGEGADGKPFLVMELLEGETLQARLRRGPLPLAEVLDLGVQVAGALEAAHAKGIVHRDLKPANIFLTPGGQAKVLDFGLAKILPGHVPGVPADDGDDAPTVQEAPLASDLTQAGSSMGTVAYMSPEQARGAAVDARSDIFSLGVVLYEAATGQVAFPGTTSAVIFDGILNRAPDLRAVRSPELAALLQKALEKDSGLRYQTAADLRADLRRLKRDSESGNTAAASPAPRRATRSPHRGASLAAAAAVVVLIATGTWFYLRRAPMLTTKDTVVLADFTNSTGDSMFNGALRQGLAAQLEQTPFLTVISDERMTTVEKLMTLAPNTPIVGAVAQQLCQRTGSAAVIAGSIAQIGNQYNLILNASNCTSGDNLTTVAETAAGKDQVLAALGTAAAALRTKLGESLASMRQYDAPIDQVTTPSLEALRAYTLGYQALTAGNFANAATLLQRALTLDPNFAMANARLATVDDNLQPPDTAAAVANITQAYAHRDQVSQSERLYITARYDDIALGDELQAEQVYGAWEQTYPNDFLPFANRCAIGEQLGQNADALADCQNAVARDPSNALCETNLVQAYLNLGRGTEAEATMEKALRTAPESPYLHERAFGLADQLHDAARLRQEAAWLQRSAEGAAVVKIAMVEDDLGAGKLRAARAELTQVENAGGYVASAPQDLMLAHALYGDNLEAPTPADLATENGLAIAALSYGFAGDAARAEAAADALERRFGHDSAAKLVLLPIARALIALARHQPAAAVSLLRPVEPYDLGGDASGGSAYVRGLALLQLRQPAAAAVEFQKVVSMPTGSNPTALLELARAQAQTGETAAARASYAKLLGIWKDADPELPAVKAARAEYAKLPRA